MKVFADTNILIDLVCSRDGFVEDAQKFFKAGLESKIEIAISSISFINTIYIGHRYGFRLEDLTKSLQGVMSFCEVASIDSSIISALLESDWKDKEDFAQYAAALSSCCDCIVTRNKNDFKDSSIPVYTVKELFEAILTLENVDEC